VSSKIDSESFSAWPDERGNWRFKLEDSLRNDSNEGCSEEGDDVGQDSLTEETGRAIHDEKEDDKRKTEYDNIG